MYEECFHNQNFECHADEIEVRSSAEGNKVESSEGTNVQYNTLILSFTIYDFNEITDFKPISIMEYSH